MARPIAILRALATAYRRDWTALQSLTGNNFFWITLFMLGQAGSFVLLILGLVLLFPLSTDPLRKIPASRLASWPLSRGDRWTIRIAGPWINPITWALAGAAVWAVGRTISVQLWAVVVAMFVSAFALSHVPPPGRSSIWRSVPPIPGRLGQLVRKNMREVLSTLDFYCALVLSTSVLLWRIVGPPLPHEALMAMTVLTLAALSSYAQCLFGLDGEGGESRYRLLPIEGWRLLLAKDFAFLLALVPLLLPLAPLAGLGGAFAVLAIGHAPSVDHPREQTRWRFSNGAAFGNGVTQMVAMAATVSTIFSTSVWVIVPAAVAWVVSLYWYGRKLS